MAAIEIMDNSIAAAESLLLIRCGAFPGAPGLQTILYNINIENFEQTTRDDTGLCSSRFNRSRLILHASAPKFEQQRFSRRGREEMKKNSRKKAQETQNPDGISLRLMCLFAAKIDPAGMKLR